MIPPVNYDLSCIGIGGTIREILLFKPKPFFLGFGDIDPLNFEDHRSGAVPFPYI